MKCFNCSLIIVTLCSMQVVFAPPVTHKDSGIDEKDNEIKDDLKEYMEYHHYLKEVVQVLESDADFRDKLEKAEEIDIRSGKIAHELDKVNHNVRSKLDELKRQELERLRHLATKEFELTNDINAVHAKINSQAQHLDHSNLHTFEVEDLKRLIKKTTADLAVADRKRREEFKQYEMQKEFEKQQKLQSLDDDHKKEYELELQEQEIKHKKHDKLHHPGTKQQLKEVWEKQDHMENQEFDPKIFFMMHDVDGNGYWDENEVKALFRKELDKMYQQGVPGSDMKERQEEMERMREHVFEESDTNRDNLISYDEFLVQTRRAEFSKDPGWKSLDEQQVYTQDEYHDYEKKRLEEIQKLIDQGLLPPHPQFFGGPQGSQQHYQLPGYPQQDYQHPPRYQQHQNQVPPNYQQHQNQVPPNYQQPYDHQYPGHPQLPPQHNQMQYPNVPGQINYQNSVGQQQHQEMPQNIQYQQGHPNPNARQPPIQQQPQVPQQLPNVLNQGQIPPQQPQTVNQGEAIPKPSVVDQAQHISQNQVQSNQQQKQPQIQNQTSHVNAQKLSGQVPAHDQLQVKAEQDIPQVNAV